MTSSTRARLRIASFLVRLRWEETTDPEKPISFFGEIEHIQSGERRSFRDLKELSALIQTRVQRIEQER